LDVAAGLATPLELPTLTWFLIAALALAAGLAGGVGGRAIRWRVELGALWDAVEQLSRRLSKREGAAGREVAIDRAKQSEFASWQQRMFGGRPAGSDPERSGRFDEASGIERARQIFAAKKGNGEP